MYIRRNRTCSAARESCENAGATVAAGMAKGRTCDDWGESVSGASLATAYFQDQEYREGFCPCEALSRGTMFPELVM